MRGLVVLTAVPLLGVVPTAAAAGTDGSAPATAEGRGDPLRKPPPRPRTHAKEKTKKDKQDAKTKKAHAKGVALHVAAPKDHVFPGQTYKWTWTFRAPRNGSVKSDKAVFRMTLPKSLAFVSGEPDCASQGRKVTCDLGTLHRGQKVRGTIRVKVDRRVGPGRTIGVRGTVTWGKTRVTRTFPAVHVARTADLVLTESAPSKARAGASIPYVLKVRNRGPATADGVIVESTGPIRLVGRDTACMPRARGYVCGVGSLRAGESRTLHLRAVPRASVRAGTVLESTWRASSPTADADRANNDAVLRTRITGRRR